MTLVAHDNTKVDLLEWAEYRVKSRTINTREEAGDLALPYGVAVAVRAIRPDDAPALQRLYGRLSKQSIHLRFFSYMKQLPDHTAKHLACVDGFNRFALVALDPDDPDEIIAVVRYDRQPPGDERAEYAALVEDRWQGLGIGTALTRRLIEAARDKGVRSFYALVMGENKRMLNIFRHLGLHERERREDGEKMVEIGLSS